MKHSVKTFAIGALMAMLVGSLALLAVAAQETKSVTGVIKAVDAAAMSLQIVEDGTNQEFTFKVETTTVITKKGKTVALGEVKAGDKAEAVLDQGKVVALRVS
jgi:Cu/Ag efflux protein CusF